MNEEIESWKDVIGYEGFYQVSSLGKLRSVRTGKIKKIHCDKFGRVSVSLNASPKKQASKRIHSLVLEAFIGPRPIGMEACHCDGNPSNNRLNNLRWDTHKNNEADKLKHGTHQYGEQNPVNILSEQDVVRMRDMRKCGAREAHIAKWFNVHRSTAQGAINGTNWKNVPYPQRSA